jgi:hypothetical protein
MTFEPQTTWRLSSTGASQRSRLPTQVRCPGSRAFQKRSVAIRSGGPAGSHPNTALMGEIAVWRAANGIKPQDPRPTGGTQLETFRALWKQRLDDISPIPPIHQTTQGPTNDSKHTPHIDADATTGKAHTRQLVNVRTGQSRPADSTAQWFGSRRSEYVIALQATMAGQAGQAAHCRVWLFLIKGRRKRRPAVGVLPTVRAAPP